MDVVYHIGDAGTNLTVDVEGNDYDVDGVTTLNLDHCNAGNAMHVESVATTANGDFDTVATTAAGGTVEIVSGGIVRYTPAANYNGPDSFY